MDIVERLRNEPEVLTPAQYWEAQADMWRHYYKESINEIERLRDQVHYHYENGLKKDVEIERLREALQTIADEGSGWGQTVAWKALKEGE